MVDKPKGFISPSDRGKATYSLDLRPIEEEPTPQKHPAWIEAVYEWFDNHLVVAFFLNAIVWAVFGAVIVYLILTPVG